MARLARYDDVTAVEIETDANGFPVIYIHRNGTPAMTTLRIKPKAEVHLSDDRSHEND